MTAEIVSVGTEILLGQIADTNAQYLGRRLAELGISHTNRQTVGDNLARLTEALRLALSRADIIFTIGGLGPTQDDLTREGIAAALEEDLIEEEVVVGRLREWFDRRGLEWIESQRRQAMRPACGRSIENPNGTAPGLICEKNGKVVIAMPGPRGEFVAMLDGPVGTYLGKVAGGRVIHSRVLRICGLGESVVEDRIRPLIGSTNPTVAPYAHPGEVHLRITASAESRDTANRLIDPMAAKVREILGDAVFGEDETTLEQAVIERLIVRNETIGVAESMTGGGIGQRLTNVAGSGDAFLGGVITYDVGLKAKLLGVDGAVLDDDTRGLVSEDCARQMAVGVRDLTQATYGLSVTGNAGPTSDKGGKPVGTVFIGLAGPGSCGVKEFLFHGQREFVRRRTEQAALTMVWQALESLA